MGYKNTIILLKLKMFLKLYKSFKWSVSGLYQCFCNEKSFQIETFVLLFTFFAGYFFSVKTHFLFLLIFFNILILVVELLNSAIEKLADLISKDFHPTIEYIKDAASAAVFLTVLCYFSTWIYIYACS